MKQAKQTFALSDTADYVLIFNSYGASLRGPIGEDGKPEYLKVRPGTQAMQQSSPSLHYRLNDAVYFPSYDTVEHTQDYENLLNDFEDY